MDIVWEYQSPFIVLRPQYWNWTLSATIWQAHRYPFDAPMFAGKDLDPERYEWAFSRKTTKAVEEEEVLKRLKSLGY